MARIEDYALVGDLLTAALIGRDGSVDWLCLPHFDSSACFAALLDGPRAGFWKLAPGEADARCERRYVADTAVLQTEWTSATGKVRVTDFMPIRGEAPDLVRIVEGLEGRVELRSELALRYGYGRDRPWLRRIDDDYVAVSGPAAAYLATDIDVAFADGTMHSEFVVEKGSRASFVLTFAASYRRRPRPVHPEKALRDTVKWWREWSQTCELDGPYEEAVRRSLITLKALTFRPTGGIVAAPTTSLPEQIGGSRNWDYRFCWLRDSALTLQALLAAGYREEATAWREWLLRAVAGEPANLQVVYTLDGSRFLHEQQLDWLSGYEGSTPVRVGNAASDQLQLDVYGELINALALTRNAEVHPSDDGWEVQVRIMEILEGAWDQPDNGIWEMRADPQHFTHSKLMAWVAADRMTRASERFGLEGPVERWRALRTQIHSEVMRRGFDAERNTFVQAYGSRNLDASTLLAGRVGFLPPDDPRMAGTVEAVERELMRDGFVHRYASEDTDDGLDQPEGAFLACSFWMVDALLGVGRTKDATELFERILSVRNDVGLLSESYDAALGRQVGNMPQAFSHLALVSSALSLESARVARSDEPVEQG